MKTAALRRPLLTSAVSRGPRLTIMARMIRWYQLSCQRYRLANLEASALEDIGITRHQAMQEASRPFWDEPEA